MKENPKPITEVIHAKYVFTQEELLELSRELGRTCKGINTLEEEKSAVGKDFSARIETNEIKRDGMIDFLTMGYQMRPTECIVVLDPKNRSKDFFRVDSLGMPSEFVERREMTSADFQLVLPETEGAK
jgi:hypothetical protein